MPQEVTLDPALAEMSVETRQTLAAQVIREELGIEPHLSKSNKAEFSLGEDVVNPMEQEMKSVSDAEMGVSDYRAGEDRGNEHAQVEEAMSSAEISERNNIADEFGADELSLADDDGFEM